MMLQLKNHEITNNHFSQTQPKLKIGQPGDKYEQEADAVADKVMRLSDGEAMQMQPLEEEEEMLQTKLRMQVEEEEEEMMLPKLRMQVEEEEMMQPKLKTGNNSKIQMACKNCEDDLLQAKSIKGETHTTEEVSQKIRQSKGTGSPLPENTNHFMSNAMGADFSKVSIHTGSMAHKLNQSLNSRAFTYGNNIYFNKGEYNPVSTSGKKLLAHELTHVVQQGAARTLSGNKSLKKKMISKRSALSGICFKIQKRGLNDEERIQMKPKIISQNNKKLIQRDLATPLPTAPVAAQPDLTDAQIQEAIQFNRRRYNRVGTRLIQNILGGPVTGRWTEDNIRAIAATQEQYGLTKDGKVGENTFRFIDNEVSLEGLPKTNANCLTSLNIRKRAENIVPRNNGATMTRQFFMDAQFPAYCNCHDFEYRQFIRGHFNHTRAGVVTDEGDWFANLPAGRLNAGWQEDGHTGVPSVNFGYRSRPTSPDDRYLNDAGRLDRANGCRYRGEDTPGGNYGGWNVAHPTTGDQLDILVQFRGEIRRRGAVVRSKQWTALRRRFTLPA